MDEPQPPMMSPWSHTFRASEKACTAWHKSHTTGWSNSGSHSYSSRSCLTSGECEQGPSAPCERRTASRSSLRITLSRSSSGSLRGLMSASGFGI